MALKCFTCGEVITFDDSILSKTGKKIPLWPDKQNTHGHDDDGNPIRGDLPEQAPQQQQKQQFYPPQQTTAASRAPPTTSQGGSYMDTKRIRVMLEEIGKKQLEQDDVIQSTYALCRNNSNMLVELMTHFKLIETTTASALHQQQKKQQEQEQSERDEKYRREPEQIKKWKDDDDNNDKGASDDL